MTRPVSLVVLPILLGLATIIAAAVVPLINQTTFLYHAAKAPKLGAIDPRFTADYQPAQRRLSATSCLMNAVNAMMNLALENFTEPITVRNYVDPAYPEVEIIPIVPRGLRIEARYLLWAVWEGIRWMMSRRSFQQLVVVAYWDGVRICSIWITGTLRHLSIAGSNGTLGFSARSEKMFIRNATVDSKQGLSMMDLRNPLSDRHLTVSVTLVGEMLGITEVFITIYAALEYMAHFPSTEEVVRFQVWPDGEETTIGILEHTDAPTVRPPFLEYQWAILSIGQLPGYMLQQRRFTEVIIEIAVDGVPLGEGFLSK